MPDPARRWPVILKQRLQALFPNQFIQVINAGVGGETSREGLARMKIDVIDHRPDYVLVEFGGNDATPDLARRVSLDEYQSNLSAMKERIDSVGGHMLLITFPPVVDKNHVGYNDFKDIGGQDAFVEQYRRVTLEFAVKHALPLADLDQVIRQDPAHFILPDGVHLTEDGNRAAADAILSVVANVLKAQVIP